MRYRKVLIRKQFFTGFDIKKSTIFMSHPAKNYFPISTFPNLNTIWRTYSYLFSIYAALSSKTFEGQRHIQRRISFSKIMNLCQNGHKSISKHFSYYFFYAGWRETTTTANFAITLKYFIKTNITGCFKMKNSAISNGCICMYSLFRNKRFDA